MKIQLKRSNVLVENNARQPTAGQMEYGELAVNYNTTDPAIFIKDSNNNIIRIAGKYNIADDGQVELPATPTPPADPKAGNLWYNNVDGRLYIYYTDQDTSQWVDASPDSWDPSSYPDVNNDTPQANTLDDRYLMLNAANDPITNDLDIGGNLKLNKTGAGARVTLNSTGRNYYISGDSGSDRLDIGRRITSDTDDSPAIAITGDGKVGINQTTNLDQQLTVLGVANDTVAAGNGTCKFRVNGGNGVILGTQASSPYRTYLQAGFVEDFNTAKYDLLLNPLGGNVAIGTDNPGSAILMVNGAPTETFTNTPYTIRSYTDVTSAEGIGGGISLGGKWNGTASQYADFGIVSGIKENNTAGNYAGALTFGTRTSGSGGGSMERMRITSIGRVGIGSTNPPAKLEVRGSGQADGNLNTTGNMHLLVSDTGTGPGNGGNIVFAAGNGTWRFASIKGSVVSGSNNTSGDIVFSTRTNTTDATLQEKLRIKDNGKLGIGTLTPDQLLEIRKDAGGTSGPGILLRNVSGTASTSCSIYFSPNTADGIGRAAEIRSVNAGTTRADVRFFVANGGTPVEAFRIDAAGSVFSAVGSNGTSSDPIGGRKNGNAAWGSNASGGGFNYYSTGTSVMKLGRNNAGSLLQFYVDNPSGGAKGVGGISTDGSNINISGQASDYRVKTNVQPFSGASALVQALNPVTYEYTDRGNGETRRGFIAHELQEQIPEAVIGEKDATVRLGNLLDWDGTILQENIPEPSAEDMEYQDEIEVTPRVEATEESEAVPAVFQTVTRTKTWEFTKEEDVLQSLDLSKMVPVLAAALKEALERIDALEQQ